MSSSNKGNDRGCRHLHPARRTTSLRVPHDLRHFDGDAFSFSRVASREAYGLRYTNPSYRAITLILWVG